MWNILLKHKLHTVVTPGADSGVAGAGVFWTEWGLSGGVGTKGEQESCGSISGIRWR